MVNNGSILSSGPTFNHLSETEYKKKKTELNSVTLFQGQIPPSVLAGKAQHEQGSLKRASYHKGIKHSKSFIKLKSK